MRATLLVLSLAVCGCGSTVPTPADPKPAAAGPAKLVVLVVFDQMRGDYLDRWAAQFRPHGFERIKKSGAWYSECHIPYACTSTGPGHVALVTGAPPAVNGIVENDWYDRIADKHTYCALPKRPYELVPPPPPGKMTRGSALGFSPEQILVPTIGDHLKAVRGEKGRVFSLSIKDRSAVMMGGQKPDAAYCYDARDGLFHTGTFYRDTPHPWVAEFNKAGLVNTYFEKKWERFKPDLDYDKLAGKDDADGESLGTNGMGKTFPHPLKGELKEPGNKFYAAVELSPFGNDLLFELAKKAIEAEKLGMGESSDLLLLGFSSNDLVGHAYGPDSHEVLDMTLRSDDLVGKLMAFLDEKVGKDKYTLVISADHGVCPIPEQKKIATADRQPLTAPILGLAKALDAKFGPNEGGTQRWFDGADVVDDLWPWVYLNRRAIEARKLKFDDVRDAAAKWLGEQSYVEVVFNREHVESGTPPKVDAPREKGVKDLLAKVKLAYRPERCGDLLVVPKPGVQVSKYAAGTGHGSPHSYDAHIPLLVYGAGVPALGKKADAVSSLSVTPTLARALGIDPPATAKEALPPGLK